MRYSVLIKVGEVDVNYPADAREEAEELLEELALSERGVQIYENATPILIRHEE